MSRHRQCSNPGRKSYFAWGTFRDRTTRNHSRQEWKSTKKIRFRKIRTKISLPVCTKREIVRWECLLAQRIRWEIYSCQELYLFADWATVRVSHWRQQKSSPLNAGRAWWNIKHWWKDPNMIPCDSRRGYAWGECVWMFSDKGVDEQSPRIPRGLECSFGSAKSLMSTQRWLIGVHLIFRVQMFNRFKLYEKAKRNFKEHICALPSLLTKARKQMLDAKSSTNFRVIPLKHVITLFDGNMFSPLDHAHIILQCVLSFLAIIGNVILLVIIMRRYTFQSYIVHLFYRLKNASEYACLLYISQKYGNYWLHFGSIRVFSVRKVWVPTSWSKKIVFRLINGPDDTTILIFLGPCSLISKRLCDFSHSK